MRDLGDEYATKDPALTVDQARADAFLDLMLTNVTVTAKVTLGIPVITGPDGEAARDAAIAATTPRRCPRRRRGGAGAVDIPMT